jgi:hypothetical protein
MRMELRERHPRRERRRRWPPPTPISPAGMVAGLTTTGCVVASGIVWLVFSYRAFACTGDCAIPPPLGGLLVVVVGAIVALMVWLAISILQQPVESSGSSGWLWGLSVIFGLGIALGAMTLPSVSCPPGQHLSVFRFCYIASNDRFPVIDKRWMKDVADVAGVVVALTLIRWRRLVFVTAPIAGAVWLVGSLDFLARRIVQA